MDRETAEHFYAWLERYVREDEQHEVEQAMQQLLGDEPELVNTHSWPEIRRLASS
jgi:hypothetical protein